MLKSLATWAARIVPTGVTRAASRVGGAVKWRAVVQGVIRLGVVLAVGTGLSGCNSGDSTRKSEEDLAIRSVTDLKGKHVDPFSIPGGKAIALVFISTDCPISNRYAPELRRLHDEFSGKGVSWWLVHADPDESADAIRKHAEEFRLPGALLRDPRHGLVRHSKVHVTPEAAVFLPDGTLVYHGRIDDWYVDYGRNRIDPTRRDLRDVLEAIVEGKPVAPRSTKAIGCPIPDAK